MLVLAGPGSGKTHVISERIRYLIEEKKVPPERILTITFTKAAAQEMKQRCHKICPRAEGAVFGTFHSVFYHFLLTSEKYRNVTLIKESEKIQIMRKLLPMFDKTEQQKLYACETMLRKISTYKNSWPAEQEADEEFLNIKNRYCAICREQEKIDFDDMLVLCHELFLSCPYERERWQKRFFYILVDEFQDVNGRQYEMTKMLAGQKGNLFVVGDDDQAIYSFRGSNPQYMKRFLADFPESRTICLEENFRCGGKIVSLACKSIGNNRERFSKQIYAAGNFDNRVCVQSFESQQEEIEYIASKIKEEGNEDTAILVRTNRHAEYVAELFWRREICCCIRERRSCFYENVWVRDILAALRFCVCGQKRSDFLMFMNKPYRGITREMLKKESVDFMSLKTETDRSGQLEIKEDILRMEKQCDLMQNMDAYGAVMLVLGGMRYREYLNAVTDGNEELHAQMKELLSELLDRAQSFSTVSQFVKHVEQYIRQFAVDNAPEPARGSNITQKSDGVQILTYHASKGLEFDSVYLPMLNSGVVPHGHMLTPEQMEEERRMFYVAMTRAKKGLYLSWHGKDADKDASVFVKELSEDAIGT
ncbi:MAG: ATP-dependent helicase [Lachnospiraceae bacterium]|nr:ATP-dependent helicase [Lachnospiraceae bacterium]